MAPHITVETARYLLPVAGPVLLLRFVLGSRVAMTFVPVSALLAGWIMDRSLELTLYTLVGALAAAAVSPGLQPRRRLFSAGLYAGFLQALIVVTLSFFARGFDLYETATGAGAALGSGLLSVLGVLIFVPIAEVLFGYSSKLRLETLANLNHPLLRELLVQAPGTYHHSIVVGALAEAGANAIEADPLLAKVGGYYHDIGKLKAPQLHAENQRGGTGSLPPEASTSGLRAHVADGLELGARNRLGAQVLEIIAQHHPGPAQPRPTSKEAGLVLLADAIEVEASSEIAARPLDPMTLGAIVERVTREHLSAGHLDECPLTFHEVHRSTSVFVEVLHSMLARHRRPPPASPSHIEDPRVVFSSTQLEDPPN
jgi:putative nucleotidyltransferase with HDIG domain